MKEKPILFSTGMVQGILDGRKSMTRRTTGLGFVNDIEPDEWSFDYIDVNPDLIVGEDKWGENKVKSFEGTYAGFECKITGFNTALKCLYGSVGDVLWVRETWATNGRDYFRYKADYKKDGEGINYDDTGFRNPYGSWKPSIHMPRKACRLFLRITDIRVERLHDISEADALAEGVKRYGKSPIYGFKNYLDADGYVLTASESFETLWVSINGRESWDVNPWVWVVGFERVEK